MASCTRVCQPTGRLKFKIVWDSKEKGKSVILCYHAMIVLCEMNRVPLIQLGAAVNYIPSVADYRRAEI
jgi:hypothetical protein